MRVSRVWAVLGAMVLLFSTGWAGSAQQRPSIKGVWRNTQIIYTGPNARTITAQPGYFIFTDGYYSVTRVNKDTARPTIPAPDKITDRERADAFSAFTARAGRYQVTAMELKTDLAVDLNPNTMPHGFATFSYKVDGKTLELTQKTIAPDSGVAQPVQYPTTFKYERVE